MIASHIEREHLRERFLPSPVEFLFVGEAPPASGRFFYRQDSGLFRAIRQVFMEYDVAINGSNFLLQFKNSGCYLIDLCGNPVDQLKPRERQQARKTGEGPLAAALRELQPAILVSFVRSIEANVTAAKELANWRGRHVALPYPGRWQRYRKIFQYDLLTLLRSMPATATQASRFNERGE